METYRFRSGSTRLLVSIPHAGTHLPPDIADCMTEAAQAVPDTDWHVDQLYDFLDDIGASVLVATHSRYVVDLNRPPDGSSLYPGQTETGICPVETFDGEAIYRPDRQPDPAAIRERIRRYWQPYHDRLRKELDRVRAQHGSAVLWDAHSIRSRVPRLFEGELPVLNLGTNDGRSCDAALAARLFDHARAVPACTAVLNGRFKGGYITRAYGDPANGIHAVQLELAQRSYMSEAPPFTFLPYKAAEIRPLLRALLETTLSGDW
jgi:N-formylglutamate deformylase